MNLLKAKASSMESTMEDLAIRDQQEPNPTRKENATNGIVHAHPNAASKIDSHEANQLNPRITLFPTPQTPANPTASKAIASMAATAYHAQGFLPSYDGASKAQAASIHRHQSPRASQNRPRVNLPRPWSQNESYDHSSHSNNSRYRPGIFGYDGSEEPVADDKTDLKATTFEARNNNSTDRKEVTNDDFDHHRPDHDNEWHRNSVNNFFKDLHEKEVKYMMARQRKNTKTAP